MNGSMRRAAFSRVEVSQEFIFHSNNQMRERVR
jgi:hypothetical protein